MSKLISDIRLYMSRTPNTDGQPHPEAFGNKAMTVTARRIALKLRELGFSLGDFDHLYLNFTTCLPEGNVQLAQRTDREHKWYRYVDVGVNATLLEHDPTDAAQIPSIIARCLLLFAADETVSQMVECALWEAVEQGEKMLVHFKEKQSRSGKAVIFLRILDSGLYHPLLCVYTVDGREQLRTDLPPCWELHALGDICLSRKQVTIKPRKNVFSTDLSPRVFPLPSITNRSEA